MSVDVCLSGDITSLDAHEKQNSTEPTGEHVVDDVPEISRDCASGGGWTSLLDTVTTLLVGFLVVSLPQ